MTENFGTLIRLTERKIFFPALIRVRIIRYFINLFILYLAAMTHNLERKPGSLITCAFE